MNLIQNIISDIVPKIIKKKPKNLPLRNEIVFQHNNLVEAKYRLSLQEKRIILWLISSIRPDDEDFKDHSLRVEDFIKIAGLNGESAYDQIKKITLKLIGKALRIHDLDLRQEIQVAWLSSVVYMENEGRVVLRFDPHMKPFLLKLKESFTTIKLSDLMQFSSMYGVRIYELLKQYESIKERTVKVIDIRDYCGVKDKLTSYKDFKRRVILAAQREINSKSDIHFEFEELKIGRKINSIKFIITKNKLYKQDKNLNQINVLKSSTEELRRESENIITNGLRRIGFTYPSINKLITQHQQSLDILKNALTAVEIQVERGNAENPRAMFKIAIEEKWNPNLFLVRKEK